MLRSRFGWTLLLVGVAILGLGWIAYSQEQEASLSGGEALTEAPIAGYLAPSFTLASTLGEEINLADFRGRPVVLNFWATWCPPCRAEMPEFQSASIKYNGQATFLGVDQGEPPSIVADFGSALSITYPLLVDQENVVSRDYNVTALPTTVFIDGRGVVREIVTGIVSKAVLEDRVERLIAEG
ncbi:MAG: redoxin domain-containing protein [Chloroflexota bacterium]|jgi:thiol-disulfide isomerase/thioredoxin